LKHKHIALKMCYLSLATILVIGSNVMAAEGAFTKEQTFVATSKNESEWGNYTNFEESFKDEEGNKYNLEAITYEIIDQKLTEDLKKTITVSGTPKSEIEENGVTYYLDESSIRGNTSDQIVTGYTDYEYNIKASDVPQSKLVKALDTSTGKEVKVECKFTGLELRGTDTIKNQIKITYQKYDSNSYKWNGLVIPKNSTTPAIGAYQKELLESVGADPNSIITDVRWVGNEYTTDSGIVCRDAVADVSQQVSIYRANYEGRIPHNEKSVTYIAKNPDGSAYYTVKATAKYGIIPVVKGFSTKTIVMISAGVIGAIAFITGLIMLLKRRKKSEKGVRVYD